MFNAPSPGIYIIPLTDQKPGKIADKMNCCQFNMIFIITSPKPHVNHVRCKI